MPKREFLMLAHTFREEKHGIGGWFMSEKLDGMRAYWDGGITRGFTKSDVPWANTEKDERYKKEPIATGLWSRYGNVIHAPDWWLNELPKIPLDGELYGMGLPRQDLMSTVKALEPGEGWYEVLFFCFDMPSFDRIFMDGFINTTNFKKHFQDIRRWVYEDTDITSLEYNPKKTTPFQSTYILLQRNLTTNVIARPHVQKRLPLATDKAIDLVNQKCTEISVAGGEGLILRKPESIWVPCRSHDLLKVKKFEDAEGTVVGYITGRRTDKGSKLLGKMGALILRLDSGQRLELSGFTDEERLLVDINNPDLIIGNATPASDWAQDNPETECPDWIEAVHFPRGSRVTFKFRGKSKDGIPQEARYWRKRN